ncbi:MAG: hypothetical protein LOY03_13575 [Cyclobacteriaceae bacterium]|nr:hypothetical protein [Cyclobacteriaceae bacterium]
MEKKKTKPEPANKDEKDKKKPADLPPSRESDEERPFDLGGLPDRDLKKNLGGCG